MNNNKKTCVFCNRNSEEVKKIFTSCVKNISVCCICISKLNEHKENNDIDNINPKKIHIQIKENFIGQDQVVRNFSSVIYKYLSSIKLNISKPKTNVMLLGPTGTGKTHLLEIVSKLFNMPFLSVDCSSLTAAGYVGDDIESVIGRYIRKAGGATKGKHGIIYFDEIDKIANSEKTSFGNASVSRDAVQQELLKIIEGHEIEINTDNKRPHMSQLVQFDTSGLLFVAGGAFSGINKTIKNTYNTNINNLINNHSRLTIPSNGMKVIIDALSKYGIIKELLARFPTILTLQKLSFDNYMSILKHKNSSINHNIEILKHQNINIDVQDDAYNRIVEVAMSLDIGARGLSYVVENIFQFIMYDTSLHVKNNCITVGKEFVDYTINISSEYIKTSVI